MQTGSPASLLCGGCPAVQGNTTGGTFLVSEPWTAMLPTLLNKSEMVCSPGQGLGESSSTGTEHAAKTMSGQKYVLPVYGVGAKVWGWGCSKLP